jgi:hypothetical protein
MEKHVMKKMLSFVGVLALAAGAQAAPFNALSYETGGGLAGIQGAGFTTSAGGFYNPTGNPTNTSAQPAAASNPWTEAQSYDSYFTISAGPSRITDGDGGVDTLSPQILSAYGYTDSLDAPGFTAGPGSHIGATGDNDGQAPFNAATPVNRARAGVATDAATGSNFTPSGVNGISGQDGIFIAQFTVNRGSTLEGGILFSVLRGPGLFQSSNLVLGGAPVAFETQPGVFQPLVLKAYLVGGNANLGHSRGGGNAGTGSGNSQRFGAADVYHLWVEVVPAPTAVAAFGLAGLAGLRRRRA